MTNSEIIDKYSTGQFISGEEFFMESEVLKFLDAAREDEAGKLKEEIDRLKMDNMTHEYNQAEAARFAPEFERQVREDEAGRWEAQLKAELERAGKLMEALEGFIDFPKEDLKYWIEQNRPVVTTVVPQLFHNAITAINEYNNKP